MPRAYLSSTYADLIRHREAVGRVILKAGYDLSAMEYYPATAEQPKQFCVNDVGRCDVYVGLFAFRYGYVPKGETVSVTEQEYRRARDESIPALIFLVKEGSPWPDEFMDNGTAKLRVENLRERLTSNHIVEFFTTPEDLSPMVGAALARHLQEWPKQQCERLMQEAKTQFLAGAFEAAEASCARLAAMHPTFAPAWYFRAIACLGGKSPQSVTTGVARTAEQHAQMAVQMNPRSGLPLLLLAAIRHYAYAKHGLRCSGETPASLRAAARALDPDSEQVAELLRFLRIDGRF